MPDIAINLTLDEANDLVYVLSKVHKTTKTHGPARLTMEPVIHSVFNKYLQFIRKTIPTSTNVNNAFITGKGKDFTQYIYHIRTLCKEYGILNVSNPTACRKEAATLAVSSLPKEQLENVSLHMGHSSSTSEKYYRSRKRPHEVTSAFTAMAKIIGK